MRLRLYFVHVQGPFEFIKVEPNATHFYWRFIEISRAPLQGIMIDVLAGSRHESA